MIYSRTEIENRERQTLAHYAVLSGESAGRVYPEAENDARTCFQRDRDRVIHSKAFRRLMEKAQVFTATSGDHFRNRMSHSIECAQVSRGMARSLGLNEDLAEAIALAHDLGHTPFGHAGEHAMNECMKTHGLRFEHNEQSLRVVEKLERMYPDFVGLNLSKEVLDGLLKHHTPFDRPKTEFRSFAHLEMQVVDMGDEIAYMSHDTDDGLRAEMFTLDEVAKYRVVKLAIDNATRHYGKTLTDLPREIFGARLQSALMHLMVADVVAETEKRLSQNHIVNPEDVRAFDGSLVGFSAGMREDVNALRVFLSERYYFSPRVKNQSDSGQTIIRSLFDFFINHPEKLPEGYNYKNSSLSVAVKDYIAGMTDGFAMREAERLLAS